MRAGLKGTTGWLVSLGLPLPVAYAVCFFEFLGGIGLLLGLLTRLAALAVIVVMVGAIAKVHWPNGFFINWELAPGRGHGMEANLGFIAMAVACLIAGAGPCRWTRCWRGEPAGLIEHVHFFRDLVTNEAYRHSVWT